MIDKTRWSRAFLQCQCQLRLPTCQLPHHVLTVFASRLCCRNFAWDNESLSITHEDWNHGISLLSSDRDMVVLQITSTNSSLVPLMVFPPLIRKTRWGRILTFYLEVILKKWSVGKRKFFSFTVFRCSLVCSTTYSINIVCALCSNAVLWIFLLVMATSVTLFEVSCNALIRGSIFAVSNPRIWTRVAFAFEINTTKSANRNVTK